MPSVSELPQDYRGKLDLLLSLRDTKNDAYTRVYVYQIVGGNLGPHEYWDGSEISFVARLVRDSSLEYGVRFFGVTSGVWVEDLEFDDELIPFANEWTRVEMVPSWFLRRFLDVLESEDFVMERIR